MGLCASLMLLSSCAAALQGQTEGEEAAPSSSTIPGIVACTQNEDLFPTDPDDAEGIQWDQAFDGQVAAILQADQETDDISCENNARRTASGPLRQLASRLPQWEKRTDDLFESDMPQVLLDYLEAYGCALEYRAHAVYQMMLGKEDETTGEYLSYFETAKNAQRWLKEKNLRLASARESIRRSLVLALGVNKLRPLDQIFTCLNRASKDLRNLTGLAAEAGSCIPVRTWDARGLLRTLE